MACSAAASLAGAESRAHCGAGAPIFSMRSYLKTFLPGTFLPRSMRCSISVKQYLIASWGWPIL